MTPKTVYDFFNEWKLKNDTKNSWGLTWFLANEFCKRFYSSHGIAPYVICREGLGYYGIMFSRVLCSVNKGKERNIGRLSMGGNIENWESSTPGSHGFEAIKMFENTADLSAILKGAFEYMNLPAIPEKTHLNCRHKRWGESFMLMFEISTMLALKNESDGISIWNHPSMTEDEVKRLDPLCGMKEHLGAFIFNSSKNKVIFASDGRELTGRTNENYWHRFMAGESSFDLYRDLLIKLGL
ncbi:MAG: hypothetical protein H6680_09605 [Desulfobacteraceae bacterium]|nr:hypothetical protein [Desulfobacteraceae bacterium]